MAGFLDVDGVKVWDIATAYRDCPAEANQKQHLLVNNPRLGDSLAAAFSAAPASTQQQRVGACELRRQVVLQRGHGFAVVGKNLQEVVYRAIYTQENAKVQRDALNACGGSGGAVHYLSREEARDCVEMADGAVHKAWPLWVKEASLGIMFENKLQRGANED